VLEAPKRRIPTWLVIVGLVLALGTGTGVLAWSRRPVSGVSDLAHRMENQGRVLVVGSAELLRLHAEGATLVAASSQPEISALLDGTDERAFTRALAAAGFGGVLVDGRTPDASGEAGAESVRARLARYGAFDTLACDYLAPTAALYEPRIGLVIDPPLDEALAHVARAILAGARSPRVSSFPEPLRRIRNVEVMVMLEDHGHPRLWRSARGSSIARALLTAAVVARQRWGERQTAMGGAIDLVLPTIDVSVYLLDEDGTLGARTEGFIERVFTPEHGVAYDHRGTWRYLLPAATREQGEGSAVRAYRALFADSDMEENSFERPDVRLYRMLARRLAFSPAPATRLDPLPDLPPGVLDGPIGGSALGADWALEPPRSGSSELP
jgi:hypothetical protein